ncbi:MAG: FkbM family methyltransferase [Rhodobacteraceae bacterium]|nr:MAG: FkbM family methyltransferase [Paracoccaceae bacterium]
MSLPRKTRIAARLGRLYPLMSGCGTIANSAFFRRFDPDSPMDATVEVTGGKARIPVHDYVGRAMLYMGELDRKISQIIDRVVDPGDVALDIGANLGLVSLRLAHRAGPRGVVHAFEPNPALAPYLAQTFAMNPALPLHHQQMALGAEASIMSLHVPPSNAGAATLRPADGARGGQLVQVPVVTLAEFVAGAGLARIDFAKIDVEGFEAEVLRGATGLPAETLPAVIVFEEITPRLAGVTPAALVAAEDLGYEIFAIARSAFRLRLLARDAPGFLQAHDYLALSPRLDPARRARLQV